MVQHGQDPSFDQFILSALLADIVGNLCANLQVVIQVHLLKHHIRLGIFEQLIAVLLGKLIR